MQSGSVLTPTQYAVWDSIATYTVCRVEQYCHPHSMQCGIVLPPTQYAGWDSTATYTVCRVK